MSFHCFHWLVTFYFANFAGMSTALHQSPVFGPVVSRRLGVSLGINLMPGDGKICTFDCIYCECGFNAERRPQMHRPSQRMVAEALEAKLREMKSAGTAPDVLTFSGNGEPTCHPQFAGVIDDTLRLRDKYFPEAKVSVLTNATMLHIAKVREALMRVDNNIAKLDTVSAQYINKVNRPVSAGYDVNRTVEQMKLFRGHVIIQTMFMRGTSGGDDIDNTGDEYVMPWIEKLRDIAPQGVMIYTIDRETPDHGLRKAPREVLDAIRARVIAAGIPCTASY